MSAQYHKCPELEGQVLGQGLLRCLCVQIVDRVTYDLVQELAQCIRF